MGFGGMTDPYKGKKIQPFSLWLRFFNNFVDQGYVIHDASLLAHAEMAIFGMEDINLVDPTNGE